MQNQSDSDAEGELDPNFDSGFGGIETTVYHYLFLFGKNNFTVRLMVAIL